jgi:purine-binding chemotaxis protein CheW
MNTISPVADHRHDPSAAEPLSSLLRMAVGELVLAVAIDDVREILQVARLTPLPRTPEFVRGVMNLRGAVVPVIDLSVRLGHKPTELGRRSCIVVVECVSTPGEDGDDAAPVATAMGLLVDAVFEVFDRHAGEIETAPALGTHVDPAFLRGITRAEGALVGVLALQQVLGEAQLRQAIADHAPPLTH